MVLDFFLKKCKSSSCGIEVSWFHISEITHYVISFSILPDRKTRSVFIFSERPFVNLLFKEDTRVPVASGCWEGKKHSDWGEKQWWIEIATACRGLVQCLCIRCLLSLQKEMWNDIRSTSNETCSFLIIWIPDFTDKKGELFSLGYQKHIRLSGWPLLDWMVPARQFRGSSEIIRQDHGWAAGNPRATESGQMFPNPLLVALGDLDCSKQTVYFHTILK